MATFLLGVKMDWWTGGVLVEHFGAIVIRLNVFALVLCSYLLFLGYKQPTTNDLKYSGEIFSDYFWGTDLYPRILGCDVKVWTNCRMGMTMWPLVITSCLFFQKEQYGHITGNLMVNVVLQLIYITKFFWWEGGYYSTIDIIVDHAGFYLCWGCLVWVPTVYTIHSNYLAFHPEFETNPMVLGAIFIFGVYCIYTNYDIDA